MQVFYFSVHSTEITMIWGYVSRIIPPVMQAIALGVAVVGCFVERRISSMYTPYSGSIEEQRLERQVCNNWTPGILTQLFDLSPHAYFVIPGGRRAKWRPYSCASTEEFSASICVR